MPRVSVIIPCHDAALYLGPLLASVREAARCAAVPVEILPVDDGSTDATAQMLSRFAEGADGNCSIRVLTQPHLGVSAARNRGLEAAQGDWVMFADADDVVDPDWIKAPLAALEAAPADYCRLGYRLRHGEDEPFRPWPVKGHFRYESAEAIRTDYLPRLIGFSFDDLRHWARGGALFDHHELGGVWCGAYRRDLIMRHHVRFDETVPLHEDALFNCAYLLHAENMIALERPLYDYTIRVTGASRRLQGGSVALANKARLLALRETLDRETGGALTPYYAGSCVMAALEMLALTVCHRVGIREGTGALVRYLAHPLVKRALKECPLFFRRPLFSCGVVVLREVAAFAG